MDNRLVEDFSGVITDLISDNPDIVAVPNQFRNSVGVYFNPKAKDGFRYVAAFKTTDSYGCTWIETFGIVKDDTKMTVEGRWGSIHMGTNPNKDDLIIQASEMVDQHLTTI
jgi:hypothetical protein